MTTAFGPPGLPGSIPSPRKRKGPTPESKLQHALVQYLQLLPWVARVTRHNTGVAWMGGNPRTGYRGRPVVFGERGHSDLSVEIRGETRVVWIETKAPGAQTKATRLQEQEAFLARKRAQGHVAFMCSSGETLRAELARAGLEVPCVRDLAVAMVETHHPNTIRALLQRMRAAGFA